MSNDTQGSDKILVVGATGSLGVEIVRMLCEAGKAVRAVVRGSSATPTSGEPRADRVARIRALGVETVDADLKQPSTLDVACRGIKTIVSTANALVSREKGDYIATVDEQGQLALIDRALAAGVEHFVFISLLPSEIESAFQTAKRRVEARLQESGLSFTILRATAFMEAWLSPLLGFDPVNGRARILGTGTNPVSWVSAHDVARFAAAATEGQRFAKKTIPLGGPDALTPLQVVKIFEELGAPKIALEFVPEPALQGMLRGASNPIEQAFAAAMLVTAHGQVVSPQAAQDLLPGRLVSVRDFAGRMLRRSLPPA